MTESNGNKKKTQKTTQYIKTFRSGAVAANVFSRQAPGGFGYLDFSLSRAWKTSNGKEGYSQSFFNKNREALHAVIDEACQFIGDGDAAIDTNDEPIEGDGNACPPAGFPKP